MCFQLSPATPFVPRCAADLASRVTEWHSDPLPPPALPSRPILRRVIGSSSNCSEKSSERRRSMWAARNARFYFYSRHVPPRGEFSPGNQCWNFGGPRRPNSARFPFLLSSFHFRILSVGFETGERRYAAGGGAVAFTFSTGACRTTPSLMAPRPPESSSRRRHQNGKFFFFFLWPLRVESAWPWDFFVQNSF